MSDRLSRGIRLYEHDSNRDLVERRAYNYWQGLNEIDEIRADPSLQIFGVGSESGAMVVHFKWLH